MVRKIELRGKWLKNMYCTNGRLSVGERESDTHIGKRWTQCDQIGK